MNTTHLFGHPIDEWHALVDEMGRQNIKTPTEAAKQLRSTEAVAMEERGKRLLAEAKLRHIEKVMRE